MTLTRGAALSLAREFCCHCAGTGYVDSQVCDCVWRAVFRACHERFRYCSGFTTAGRVSLDASFATHRRSMFSLKSSEYVSDFVLLARRKLSADDYPVFNLHFILGADWRMCAKKLGIDKSAFWHDVYRIQGTLGQAFVECEPYGLFPTDSYFSQAVAA